MAPELLVPATWRPALDALRAGMPADAERALFTGSIFDAGSSGSTVDVGASTRRGRDAPDPMDALFDVAGLARRTGTDDVAMQLTTWPDGRAEALVWTWPESVASSLSGTELTLDLVPGALPAAYRTVAEPGRGRAAAESADPASVRAEVIRRRTAHGGVSSREIDVVNATLGRRLPDEIAALYEMAGSGEVRSDDGRLGFQIVPLGHPARDEWLPAGRFPGWGRGGRHAICRDGRVQNVSGSPWWFVFGVDADGDALASDLAPGPNGRVGQVLRLARPAVFGAEVLAGSLTELLVDGATDVSGTEIVDTPGRVNVTHRTGADPAGANAAGIDELQIGLVRERVDLSPIAGNSALRSLSAVPKALIDVEPITTLPALEYLALGRDDWRRLIALGAVPSTLVAAGIHRLGDPDLHGAVRLANELLERSGRPLVEVHEVIPATR